MQQKPRSLHLEQGIAERVIRVQAASSTQGRKMNPDDMDKFHDAALNYALAAQMARFTFSIKGAAMEAENEYDYGVLLSSGDILLVAGLAEAKKSLAQCNSLSVDIGLPKSVKLVRFAKREFEVIG
jgi:hypothetical protein